jgi:hypothetical protein
MVPPLLPDRVPTFTMFGNDNYFDETSSSSTASLTCVAANPACLVEDSGFAWNHGDYQTQITRTWFGMVGPGVPNQGRFDAIFSDHTDLRPTILTLVGLKDDYVHDGRVLVENLDPHVLPMAVRESYSTYVALAQAFKQINATKGSVGVNSLTYANRAVTSDDATYAKYLTTIGTITAERDQLASQMITLLNGAAFENQPINGSAAAPLIEQAQQLIAKVEGLAIVGH